MKHNEKVWLTVSYDEKDLAKPHGARWDGSRRKWFAPAGLDLRPLAKWCPPDIKILLETKSEKQQSIPDKGEHQQVGIDLRTYLAEVSSVIHGNVPSGQWVRAEIISLEPRKSGYQMELADIEDGKTIAKIRAWTWKESFDSISAAFEKLGLTVTTNIQTLLRVNPKYDPLWGFSVVIEDIDPQYQLGKMAQRRREIMDRLDQIGITENNKRIPPPQDFTRVVVLSPRGSAGRGDFDADAERLSRLGLCQFTYVTAVFSGPNSSKSLPDGFKEAVEAAEKNTAQGIVILRGGGAETDLIWLNNGNLAEAICRSKFPVYTALGHMKDRSILDDVAHQSFDTPSKVIGHIRNKILTEGQTAIQNHGDIRKKVQFLLQNATYKTENHSSTAKTNAVQMVQLRIQDLKQDSLRLKEVSASLLKLAGISATSSRPNINTVRNILQISRGKNQQRLKACHQYSQTVTSSALRFTTENWFSVRFDSRNTKDKAQIMLGGLSINKDSTQLLALARLNSENLMTLILNRKPEDIMRHGFCISRATNGELIRDVESALQEVALEIEYKDGKIIVQQPTISSKEEKP